jgi:K(+)-stimulated pyrophosphate-energized sodium pump
MRAFFAVVGLAFTSMLGSLAQASEASLVMPDFALAKFNVMGHEILGTNILYAGLVIGALGILFGLIEFSRVKSLQAHKMLTDVSELIYSTCKTYLMQQGKLLIILEVFIGVCIVYYFGFLQGFGMGKVATILSWSVLGILGSFSVAWFGIRLNTYANARTAFQSLRGKPYPVMDIPLRSGMAIGVVLIGVEIILLISILLFVSPESAGACFIGFAIGESLGAAALRICGGIFTKIADIASDLMKIALYIK